MVRCNHNGCEIVPAHRHVFSVLPLRTGIVYESSTLDRTVGAVIEAHAAQLAPTYGPPPVPEWLKAARAESRRPDPRQGLM